MVGDFEGNKGGNFGGKGKDEEERVRRGEGRESSIGGEIRGN